MKTWFLRCFLLFTLLAPNPVTAAAEQPSPNAEQTRFMEDAEKDKATPRPVFPS